MKILIVHFQKKYGDSQSTYQQNAFGVKLGVENRWILDRVNIESIDLVYNAAKKEGRLGYVLTSTL